MAVYYRLLPFITVYYRFVVEPYLYDSPYHGDFSMCGNLRISKDGARIFTRCGNIFRSAESQPDDMIYSGSLDEVSLIQQLGHSIQVNEVALIPDVSNLNKGDEDTKIYKYDYDFLAYKEDLVLPGFVVNGDTYAGHGRFFMLGFLPIS